MRIDIIEKKDKILEMIEANLSKSKICSELKCKSTTLDSYLEKFGIKYKGNIGRKGTPRYELRKDSNHYLNKINFISSYKLKLKLIEDKIKEHKCERCNLSNWLGEPIPIELHHIDGDRFNNNLENLQILCPNCHSKTDNNSGKKSRKEKFVKKRKEKNKYYCECGLEIKRASKNCVKCSKILMRKNDRPMYDILISDIQKLGFVGTGKKYSVSDNCIRKWKIYYEKQNL